MSMLEVDLFGDDREARAAAIWDVVEWTELGGDRDRLCWKMIKSDQKDLMLAAMCVLARLDVLPDSYRDEFDSLIHRLPELKGLDGDTDLWKWSLILIGRWAADQRDLIAITIIVIVDVMEPECAVSVLQYQNEAIEAASSESIEVAADMLLGELERWSPEREPHWRLVEQELSLLTSLVVRNRWWAEKLLNSDLEKWGFVSRSSIQWSIAMLFGSTQAIFDSRVDVILHLFQNGETNGVRFQAGSEMARYGVTNEIVQTTLRTMLESDDEDQRMRAAWVVEQMKKLHGRLEGQQ